MSHYAGIGSRQTPPDVQALMIRAARWLHKRYYTLRSGGARGADTAFAMGAGALVEIFRPEEPVGEDAVLRQIAEEHHPAWKQLDEYARRCHTRNVAIILGRDPDITPPCQFVLCWTPGASGEGGTGQAIRVARAYGIPVYDLADAHAKFRVESCINSMFDPDSPIVVLRWPEL